MLIENDIKNMDKILLTLSRYKEQLETAL